MRCSKAAALALLAAGLGILHCSAQNWESIHLPGYFSDWGTLYIDEQTNTLYATGINQVYPGGPAGVFAWQGTQWDTIGLFSSQSPKSILRYNDTLLVAGSFQSQFDGMPLRIAYLDSSGWQPYGEFNAGINRLRVIDGDLHAVGGFSMVDGQPCDGIAKRVGGHWEPVGDFGEVPSPYLFDVIKYDGKLVCCGNMSIVGEDYRDVYVFENGQWGPLGGGLLGSQSGGWVMTVYNGELILGGGFYISAGNAGQGIMRWNGSIWQPLGVGPMVTYNSYQYTPHVYALTEHEGKLFVGGGFNFAGNVPAQGIAVWDGAVWCGLGSDLQLVHDIVFYNDTLLAMCNNNTVDGQDISGGVRYLHTTYADTCSLGTGMQAGDRVRTADVNELLLCPNPANALVTVDHRFAQAPAHAAIRVRDVLGKPVLTRAVSSVQGQTVIALAGLQTGAYTIELLDQGATLVVQRLIVQ